MTRLLHESLEAGGLGFSTTLSFTHSDGDGQPVGSRWATNEEVLALCRAVSEHEGTSLEYVTDGCLRGFTDAEVEQMAEMTLAGRRPLNWNVLTIDSKEPQRYHDQLAACENARAKGGTVVALTMPILVEMNMSFRNYCALFMMPGWSEVMNLPVPERIEKLRDPETRKWMDERANSPEAGVFAAPRVVGSLHDRRHLLRGQRRSEGQGRGEPRARAGQTGIRHAARHRDQRRPAYGAVAAADRQRRRVVEDAGRGVGPPAGDDRRLRRGRAPRPHVRCALPDQVPRRLHPRPQARLARTLRAAHDPDSRRAVRSARPRARPRGLLRRPVPVRSRDGRHRRGAPGRRPPGRHVAAVRRARSACTA